MRSETISIHGGFRCDPATKAVAAPIYQNVAYEFDSADHGAALFNLEAEGFRYSRIANPTADILERRVAELEGGVAALSTASGQAALHYAIVTLADHGGNIVTMPQLYGTTHTLFAHVAAAAGDRGALCGERPRRGDRAVDRRKYARGVLREHRQSGGQHLRHRGAGESRAPARRAARRRQYRGDADPAAPDRPWRGYRGAFADKIHGRPRRRDGRRDRRRRRVRLERPRARAFRCSASPTNPITAWSMPSISARRPMSRAAAASISARPARCWRR